MRVREWYGWHFPEMTKIVGDNIQYAKAVSQRRRGLQTLLGPPLAAATSPGRMPMPPPRRSGLWAAAATLNREVPVAPPRDLVGRATCMR
jgi:hypothetical protein